ncbi:YegP family protein [Arthrobacter sp. 35W]|uniref:YegP family protein n=1 Tax=Arthrobacter sp. 35W TaxID=1132441 RepID=UPI00047CF3EA|nr:DUF1508 domain-containing protein [Arthrobacter sp. 35W]
MEGSKDVAGAFEIVKGPKDTFSFKLRSGDGSVVAVSPDFPSIKAVVAGINAVRENAATGLVVDRTSNTGSIS